MERLVQLYNTLTGKSSCKCEKIPGGGSNRCYYRLSAEDGTFKMIGAIGTSLEENNAFIALSKHFSSLSLPVPKIYAVSDDGLAYLQSDLGNRCLYDALKGGRESSAGYQAKDISLLEKTVRLLPRIQVLGGESLDFSVCYPQESMDEQNVLFDLNYFKYCFLKTTDVDFNEMKLEQCFRSMAKDLSNESYNYFMYRDFQARNVMLTEEGDPQFIDYQGGRRGPLQYDLVSFLWQASSHFNANLREHLINVYLEALQEYVAIDVASFKASIAQWVLFRTLQVLGAYGFRGRFERKMYFLDSIPLAIENLRDILKSENACPYPYLYKVLQEMVELPEFNVNKTVTKPSVSQYDGQGELKLRIFSFSYKKGIPADNSGNGGGYVFDCRSTHNPGRYEPYKKLTGLDTPVIEFLENDGEILTFLESVYKLADAHVERYMQRGFTSLMFCFGCTGGQHRSVYSAQHLALHLNQKYGIEVDITHREQGINTVLPARRKAMIFAAGMGTRLKPITDRMPKALVEIAGKPLIEHVLRKLVSSGFNDIVVNIHHFADMIEEWGEKIANSEFFKKNDIRISFSDERTELLETGGGILHALPLLSYSNPESKVLIHNVDILSNVDLEQFWNYSASSASAVLLVSKRKTARYLIFNDDMRLVGWTNIQTGEIKTPYKEIYDVLAGREPNSLDVAGYHLRAFAGIHSISLNLVSKMQSWPSKFGIVDFYISLCKDVEIKGYVQDGLRLVDVGKLTSLSEAEDFLMCPQA